MTLVVWNTTSEPTPFHLNTSAWEWNGGEPHPNTTSDGLLCPQVQVCIELYWDCLVRAIPLPTFVAAWQLVWQWPPQGWTGTRSDRNWNAHGKLTKQNGQSEVKIIPQKPRFFCFLAFNMLFSSFLSYTDRDFRHQEVILESAWPRQAFKAKVGVCGRIFI